MDEFQIASAELQAADVEFERLKVNPEKPEAWDALERRYQAHKRLWLMFGGESTLNASCCSTGLTGTPRLRRRSRY